MWHLKKYNKGVNEAKQKQIHRNKEQTGGYQWREGSREGQYKGRGVQVKTIRYKISYKDILYYTWNIANIL